MASGGPPNELKRLQIYLSRATELDEREPLMAYYCRLCAVKVGMLLVTPANKSVLQPHLLQIMDLLEKTKKEFQEAGGTIPSDEDGKEYVKAFAYKVFLLADNEDRAGNANDKTAKKFLAASTFYDILKVFGDLAEDVQEKQRYAKWKASDILKAIKEGRKPTPGPPGGDPNLPPNIANGAPVDNPFESSTQSPPPTFMNTPPPSNFNSNTSNNNFNNISDTNYNNTSSSSSSSSQRPSNNFVPNNKPSNPAANPGFGQHRAQPQPQIGRNSDDEIEESTYDPEMIAQVQKHCKFAISALNYEDLPTAIDNMEKGLKLLKSVKH